MRMNRKSALVAGAGMAVALLAACSDPVSGPSAPVGLKTNLDVAGTTTGITSAPVPSEFRVCKEGNVAGTFTVTRVDDGGGSQSNTVVTTPYVIQPGTCAVVAEDDSPSDFGSRVTVTETSAGLQSITGQAIEIGQSATTIDNPQNGATYSINSIHGIRLTFTNHVEPPSTGCTYTKGWYQNKNGSPTVTDVGGRLKADAQAIFAATPGKPGSVTFQGNNSLLNLYQQYLAALLNGGAAGPQAVQDAINAVAAGTGGTGQAITTTLTQAEISSLTETLSAFNEGTLPGWPHCD